MVRKRHLLVIGGLAIGVLLALSACGTGKTPTPIVIRETVEAPASSEAPVEVPFLDKWSSSAHADSAAVAFNHWNEDDPAEIPTTCAKCHSTPGYQDFLGIDGTAAGAVDNAAPIGTVITCVACHNDATRAMTSVSMPSGLEITGLGPEARCMQCHQGRESTVSVNAALDKVGVGDDTSAQTWVSSTSTTSPPGRLSTAPWRRAGTSTKANPTTSTSPMLMVWTAVSPAMTCTRSSYGWIHAAPATPMSPRRTTPRTSA